MKYIAIIFFFLLTPICWSQNKNIFFELNQDSIKATLNFIKTNRVDDLLIKKKRSANNKLRVYRIQLFSGKREGSNQIKMKFKNLYPEVIVETSYEQPYFKTKVGAFRSKMDAEKNLLQYKKHFKNAFIFEENISIKKL